MSGGPRCCNAEPCPSEQTAEPSFKLPDGTLSRRCPRKLITNETIELLRWYRHYKAGFLPAAGGLLDQTAYFYDAMLGIERLIGQHDGKS